MSSKELQIRNRLVDLSLQQEQSSQYNYHNHLLQSLSNRQIPSDDVSEWKILTNRQASSMENLEPRQKKSYQRCSLQGSYVLPRITTRNIFNSVSLNSDDIKNNTRSLLLGGPQFNYFSTPGDYTSEAVIINKQRFRQTQQRVNTVNLKLAYDSPVSKVKSMIHNNNKQPPPLNGSSDLIKKIEKKKKQLEMAVRMKQSQLANSKDYVAKELHPPLERYPFERKVVDKFEPEGRRRRISRRKRF